MAQVSVPAFRPADVYCLLSAAGGIVQQPGGEAFWSRPEPLLNEVCREWLVSEFTCTEDWPAWEMHPGGDEFVYLLDGDIEFLLEMPAGVQPQRIAGSGAVVVPRGVWHTARVFRESRLLFITLGAGTRHKPHVRPGTG